MANLSQLTLPVKDTITGEVTPQTFDLAGSDSANFIGTRAEWDALTTAEKEEYDTMDIYGEYNDAPIDPVPTQGSTNAVASGGVYDSLVNKSSQSDLASISETGSTASQAITKGTYFYLNGELVRAIANIASEAAFTLNTNYEIVTAGALNEINNLIKTKLQTFTDVSLAGQVTTSLTVSVDNGYKLLAVIGVDYWGSAGKPIQVIAISGNVVRLRSDYDASANTLKLYFLEIKENSFA